MSEYIIPAARSLSTLKRAIASSPKVSCFYGSYGLTPVAELLRTGVEC